MVNSETEGPGANMLAPHTRVVSGVVDTFPRRRLKIKHIFPTRNCPPRRLKIKHIFPNRNYHQACVVYN